VPAGLWNYDANDRFTAGDTYDANGNTISSGGIANVYDFENHLIQKAGVTIVYDGDGNRVSKTVAGVTTTYLVDTLNPTGYAQVLAESFAGASGAQELSHNYVYGLELVSQARHYFTGTQSLTQTIYYVYDGHGSIRALTGPTGAVTDTYDYDAFGNLIHSTGTSPNNYLFAGEQFDPDLNLYYNRARYLNTGTGRFWTMDDYAVNPEDPETLHRYLYVRSDPVNTFDPSGNDFVGEEIGAAEDIEIVAQDAQAVENVLQGIERASQATDAAAGGGGPGVATFIAAGVLGVTGAVAADALKGRVNADKASDGCNCDAVFHYTDLVSAALIFKTDIMFTSRAIKSRGLPSGAYATDIAPWDLSYTQMTLKQVLYFSPGRQETQDVSAFVALCNDSQPGFHAIANQPHQFVKEGAFPDFVGVHAVSWGFNAMSKGNE
jgi:RHS repeat-associated protein